MEQAKTKKEKTIDIIKKVAWGILLAVFGFVAVTLVWLAVDKFIVKSPVPKAWGYATLTIETGSMNGYSAMVKDGKPKQVSIGDLIVIKKTGDYTIGDVITFLPEGDRVPTTHRIIGYTENGYITKGDANNTQDTVPIEKDRVLGEVVMHSPNLGKFASWVKIEGWLYIVSGLAILAIGTFVISLSSENEKVANTQANASSTGEKAEAKAEDSAKAENQTQTESNASNCDKDKNTDQKPQKKDDDA